MCQILNLHFLQFCSFFTLMTKKILIWHCIRFCLFCNMIDFGCPRGTKVFTQFDTGKPSRKLSAVKKLVIFRRRTHLLSLFRIQSFQKRVINVFVSRSSARMLVLSCYHIFLELSVVFITRKIALELLCNLIAGDKNFFGSKFATSAHRFTLR